MQISGESRDSEIIVSDPGEIKRLIEIASSAEMTRLRGQQIASEETQSPQQVTSRKNEFTVVAPAGRGKRRIITSVVEDVNGKKAKPQHEKEEMFRKQIGNFGSFRISLLSRGGVPEVWIAADSGVAVASREELAKLAAVCFALAYSFDPYSDDQPKPAGEIKLGRKKYAAFASELSKAWSKACAFARKSRRSG